MAGELVFHTGPMGCGKSLRLQSMAYDFRSRGLKVISMTSAVDTRADHTITSRNGMELNPDALVGPSDNPFQLLRKLGGSAIDLVCVDEAQFFKPRQIDSLARFAIECEARVSAFGLKTDFRTHLFPASKRLLEIADRVEEIYLPCRCGHPTMFNTRKVNGVYVFSGNQVAIDGQDDVSYDALCKSCYENERKMSAERARAAITQQTYVTK